MRCDFVEGCNIRWTVRQSVEVICPWTVRKNKCSYQRCCRTSKVIKTVEKTLRCLCKCHDKREVRETYSHWETQEKTTNKAEQFGVHVHSTFCHSPLDFLPFLSRQSAVHLSTFCHSSLDFYSVTVFQYRCSTSIVNIKKQNWRKSENERKISQQADQVAK